MEISQIVSSIILGLISILLLIYSFFTSKEKGPILSNTYLWATSKEREKMDKSAEYHLVTVVFGILGMIFLLLTIRTLSSWSWINYIIGILIVIVISYAIIETIKTEKNK
jgi:uncharacterized membrane protein